MPPFLPFRVILASMNKIAVTLYALFDSVTPTFNWLKNHIGPRLNPDREYDTLVTYDPLTSQPYVEDVNMRTLALLHQTIIARTCTTTGEGWRMAESVYIGPSGVDRRELVIHIDDDVLAVQCRLSAPWDQRNE